MTMKIYSQKRKKSGYRAQAMVEFAIALPVLMVLLVGIMEVGRMILTYALVNNSSRDAVRYASAVGRGDDGLFKYNNCAGIKTSAQQSAYIVTLTTISISYKDENGNSAGVCDATSGEDPDIKVDSGYRVSVTVTASYSPVVKLIPIGTKTFTATSSRTILGIFDLDD
jgi:Flp pilus assembly protein TadG